ncbi:MAG: site-specific integrase [Thermoguttaceae bacterium]|nr:site-specific integrase [Thermoguttaceae bacterium]
MASLDRKNGSFIVLISLNGKQKKIYTGLKDRREADRLAEKIQRLADSKRNEMNLTESGLAEWVKKLETGNSKVYEKLVSLGLLEQKEKVLTLADVCKHYLKRSEKRGERTQNKYERTVKLLYRYFGQNKPVAEITTDDAYVFDEWFKTAPLNTRTGKDPETGKPNPPRPYATYTINRELVNIKSVFGYALKLGVIQFNPFAVIQAGSDGDSDNKTYVPAPVVLEVIQAETTLLKWKVIMALGRFAGCRGASDLCLLEWGDIVFSDGDKKGKITLKGKTKPGTIPLSPVLENLLREWQGEAILQEIDSQKVFPEINKNTNVWEMTKKSIEKAGKEVWLNPWYSLRDSFCIDVLDLHLDPKSYSHICRHSMQTAMKYYQKYTEHREKIAGVSMEKSPLWIDFGSVGDTFEVDPPQESGETLAEYRSLEEMKRGIKWGIVRGLNRGLQGGLFNVLDVQRIKREIIDMLENTALEEIQDPQKKPLAISCKRAGIPGIGLEPMTR